MRILVVEDEQRIAGAIKKGLELEKYAVDVAFTGSQGYDLASTEDYDVIMLDILLPELDGVGVCKKLRENRVKTPILMLTAKGLTEDKVRGLDAGADDYLTKPFAFDELLARIRALIRRPKNKLEAPLLTVDDLSLDPANYKVMRDGVEISLSAKEFSMLQYLMRNPGKILKKDQIIANVWDYDADVLPNTVEVYIKNLRTKIDDPFKQKPKLIKTLRGFGYKIG